MANLLRARTLSRPITIRSYLARSAIHPDKHLAEELREIGMAAAALAREIDLPVERVAGIIEGRQDVTADTALRFGDWFGTSPEFWPNLQSLYELRRARLG